MHLDIIWDSSPTETGEHTFHAYLCESNLAEQDWKSLRPYFGWKSEQVIQSTCNVTSRFGGTVPQHDYLKKHLKSRNPVFNTPRRNEPVATLTIFSDQLPFKMTALWQYSLWERMFWHVMLM